MYRGNQRKGKGRAFEEEDNDAAAFSELTDLGALYDNAGFGGGGAGGGNSGWDTRSQSQHQTRGRATTTSKGDRGKKADGGGRKGGGTMSGSKAYPEESGWGPQSAGNEWGMNTGDDWADGAGGWGHDGGVWTQEQNNWADDDDKDDGAWSGAWDSRHAHVHDLGSEPPARQGHWTNWAQEVKQSQKVTSDRRPKSGSGESRNILSPQQQSQIYNTMLNQPNPQGYSAPASQYGSAYGGNYGYQRHEGQHQQQSNKQGKQQKQQQKQQQKEGKRSKKNKQDKQNQNQYDGWGTNDNWGDGIPEEGEYFDELDDYHRRVHFSNSPTVVSALGRSQKTHPEPAYTMPSKTMAHASRDITTPLQAGLIRNGMNEYADVRFIESKGAALANVQKAFFGTSRMASDRIHWLFPPDKDERVASLLAWIQAVRYSLGGFGLHKFLQTRERGALVTNADFRPPNGLAQPAFDWLTFDQLQATMDKIFQESVAFYDPAVQVVVFVFLPSKSGNSMAVWRRKINVPNNLRLAYQDQIHVAMRGLRQDYVVHVDELPSTKAALPAQKKTAKKRKWWRLW